MMVKVSKMSGVESTILQEALSIGNEKGKEN